jgi:hypothetical protein
VSKSPAPSNLTRDSSGLDIVGGHRRDSLVLVRIEGLSFGLDGLYPEFAESIDEQAVRCDDALVKWGVRGARRERAFERVERGQEGKQGVTPAFVMRPSALAPYPPPEVLEVREQSNVRVLLFTERTPEFFGVFTVDAIVAIPGIHALVLVPCQ